MLMFGIGAGVWILGSFAVAGALPDDLRHKPKTTTAVVVLWPIVLPLAALVAVLNAVIPWRLWCRRFGHRAVPNWTEHIGGVAMKRCRVCGTAIK